MDLKARLEAARAAKAAAEAQISDADRAEQADRAELAKVEAETRAAAHEARELDLARRLDAAREALGPDMPLFAYDAEDRTPGAGTYILKAPPAKAVIDWQKGLHDPKVNREAANRDFAAVCVQDFNGATDINELVSAAGGAMLALWKRLPFVVTTLTNIGSELGGLVLDARKS